MKLVPLFVLRKTPPARVDVVAAETSTVCAFTSVLPLSRATTALTARPRRSVGAMTDQVSPPSSERRRPTLRPPR